MSPKVMVGKTIIAIKGMEKDSKKIKFYCSDGSIYLMYHEQDCCEDVWLEDVIGNINKLLYIPLLKAEEVVQIDESGEVDSRTYTFYHFATMKGYVTLRWCGESNGYYSESVDFIKISSKEEWILNKMR